MVITRKTSMFALGGVVILFLLIDMIQETSALEPTPPRGATTPTTQTPQTAQTDRIIVKYGEPQMSARMAADRTNVLSNQIGISLQLEKIMSGNAQVLRLDRMRNLDEVQDIANRIAAQPGVVYAEPDAVMQIQQAPNDPRYNEQWHYYENTGGINLPGAWQVATGNNVVVAVIDTGIRNHSDLAGHILNGYDFITDVPRANDGGSRDADPLDPGDWCPPNRPNSSWHGTHVSGTIAAITNNAAGAAGVARNASILPVRVLGKCGGFLSDIADGMRWAAGIPFPPESGVPANPTPAQVLNLSLGGLGACGPTYSDAISEIRQRGVTVVVAAGNSNEDVSQHRPANCAGVIAVAATNRTGGRAYYSNFGSLVTIAAPGGETRTRLGDGVLSTLNTGSTSPEQDNYAFYQGTSMAAPHVAGVVALLYEAKPGITPDEIESILKQTARAFPPASGQPCNTSICGAGIVNADAAVAALFNWGCWTTDGEKCSWDSAKWGGPGYISLVGDVNGDGKADRILYRAFDGNWGCWTTDGEKCSWDSAKWGDPDHIPLVGDVNGDGKADRILYRAFDGNWGCWITDGEKCSWDSAKWGDPDHIPLVGDVNRDGKADRILYRAFDGNWGCWTTDGEKCSWDSAKWGDPDHIPLVGDVNGDGKADRILYRAFDGNWGCWITDGEKCSWDSAKWGDPGHIPLVGDVNRDGKADRILYRAFDGNWGCWTTDGEKCSWDSAKWGSVYYVPLVGDVTKDGKADRILYRAGQR